MMINREHVNLVFFDERWNETFGYTSKSRLYCAIPAIKNFCHGKIKAGLILGALLDCGKATRA